MQEQIQANIPYAAVSPTDSEGQQSRRNNPRHKNIREAMEMTMHILFLLCGIVAVAFVLLISIYLIISGIPAIREVGLVDFLFGQRWAPTNKTDPAYGILPFILTSVYGTAGAVLVGVPIGLMTAIYLSKCAPPKVAALIHTAVELLAGIPSVVYGLVGMIVLVPAIRNLFDLSSGASLLPYQRFRFWTDIIVDILLNHAFLNMLFYSIKRRCYCCFFSFLPVMFAARLISRVSTIRMQAMAKATAVSPRSLA